MYLPYLRRIIKNHNKLVTVEYKDSGRVKNFITANLISAHLFGCPKTVPHALCPQRTEPLETQVFDNKKLQISGWYTGGYAPDFPVGRNKVELSSENKFVLAVVVDILVILCLG